jgi:hypothetical protein
LALARLQLQPPLTTDCEKRLRSGIGQSDWVACLDQLATALEDDQRCAVLDSLPDLSEPLAQADPSCATPSTRPSV